MKKPPGIEGPTATLRWMASQAWRDLKSVYYANTPVWRWLKSGTLVFLGLCVWSGASVLLSLRPEWRFLFLFIAYGFLLVLWGPLTHLAIVPTVLKLRRTADRPTIRVISQHGGKINLSIFFTLVLVLAVLQPGVIMLDFAPVFGPDGEPVRGELQCDGPVDGLITCEIRDGSGFDHAVVTSGGTELARADEAPYRLEFHEDDLVETRTGKEYRVEYRNADGERLRTQVRTIPQ